MKSSLDNTPSQGLSPAESEAKTSDARILAWTSSTYIAEGLPWSLLHQVTAEFFTTIGVSAAGVGRTSLLHGPMIFKVIWSPLIELWGTLRSWVVFTQAAMGVLVAILAVAAETLAAQFAEVGDASGPAVSPPDTSTVWLILVVIGTLSALHDIACDGFYMESLDDERQARFSGVRVAAYRAAMLLGSSGLVLLGARVSWLFAFGSGAALLLLLALLHQIFLPGSHLRQKEKQRSSLSTLPGSRRDWRQILETYLSFLRQDSVLLVVAFLVLYKMADALMFSMSSVFLARELGIGAELRALIRFFSVIAGIAGAVGGGVWIAKRGLDKTLFLITVLMVVSEPLYAILAFFSDQLNIFHAGVAASFETFTWEGDGVTLGLVTGVIVVEQIFGGFATAAQVVFIMRRCGVEHKTAHYAFSTVIISLTHMGLGLGSGVVYESVGATNYFWIVSALALPAVPLALVVPKGAPLAKTSSLANS